MKDGRGIKPGISARIFVKIKTVQFKSKWLSLKKNNNTFT